MAQINIQFTRFSAFYSPLISTISGGFPATLDVFEHVGRLTRRHPYEDVCASPPGDD